MRGDGGEWEEGTEWLGYARIIAPFRWMCQTVCGSLGSHQWEGKEGSSVIWKAHLVSVRLHALLDSAGHTKSSPLSSTAIGTIQTPR